MKNILTLSLLIALAFIRCESANSGNNINLPSDYLFLTQQSWYLAEVRDTSYDYYDTLTSKELTAYKKNPSKNPKVIDPCELNTAYIFKVDGTVVKKLCTGEQNILLHWNGVVYNSDSKKWLLNLMEGDKSVYISFTDTIPGNGLPYSPLTDISQKNQLVYFSSSAVFGTGGSDTPKINDTLSVYHIKSQVRYRVAKPK